LQRYYNKLADKNTAPQKLLDAMKALADFLPSAPAPVDGYLGDVDCDGFITVTDALIVLRAAAGKIELNGTQKRSADVSKDGVITVTDALLILQFAVGKITTF